MDILQGAIILLVTGKNPKYGLSGQEAGRLWAVSKLQTKEFMVCEWGDDDICVCVSGGVGGSMGVLQKGREFSKHMNYHSFLWKCPSLLYHHVY